MLRCKHAVVLGKQVVGALAEMYKTTKGVGTLAATQPNENDD